ncbi:MAG: hypothetical protein JF602_09450 [Gemmatimonadetes bacterium]|jgi:hypothetical protein|nr:hypothetical protein [Gemmatimonadota bacterium]
MVSDRRGGSSLGCLLSLLIFVSALYYGVHIGEVYLRYYRLLDAMRFQASIAPSVTDDVIKRRLMAAADSLLGQTPAFQVLRGGNPARITIQAQYRDSVDLPFFKRAFPLHPRAEAPL